MADDQETPQELLQVPAIQAVLAGHPPAVSANLKQMADDPIADLIKEGLPWLRKAGFGLYRSMGGEMGVLYNRFHVHPEELKAADKAGQLQTIAPPLDALNHAVSKSGINHPILHAKEPPAQFRQAPAAAPPQFNSGMSQVMQPAEKQTPAATLQKLMTARVKNMQGSAPSAGTAPGAGRLLNRILTPAV